jgi:hypothetical protein
MRTNACVMVWSGPGVVGPDAHTGEAVRARWRRESHHFRQQSLWRRRTLACRSKQVAAADFASVGVAGGWTGPSMEGGCAEDEWRNGAANALFLEKRIWRRN